MPRFARNDILEFVTVISYSVPDSRLSNLRSIFGIAPPVSNTHRLAYLRLMYRRQTLVSGMNIFPVKLYDDITGLQTGSFRRGTGTY